MHIHTKSTITLLMLCAAGMALVSCAPVGRSMQRIGTAIHQESTEIDRRVRDMFDSEELDDDERPKTVTPAYCYRTWGEVNCYSEPLPGEAHRFVGKQEPEPAFADNAYPYPESKPLAAPSQEMIDSGGVIYEVPEYAIREREDIPEYKKPRELIPMGEEY